QEAVWHFSVLQVPQHQVRVWKDIDPSQSLDIPTLPAHVRISVGHIDITQRRVTARSDYLARNVSAKGCRCTPSHPDIQLIVSAELQTVYKQGLNGNEWCQNRAPDPEAGISSQDRTTRGYSLAGGGRTRPMRLAGNDAPCCPIRSANSQTNVQ
ncbi:hypothetical protein CMEL01_10864, partial [Colletotrichum melonis]